MFPPRSYLLIVFFSLWQLIFQMVAVIGVIMNGSNLLGYVRCKWGTKKDMSSLAKNFLTAQVLKSVSTQKPNTCIQTIHCIHRVAC